MPFVDELLDFVTDIFVETGTFQGDTIDKIKHKCSTIISLELSETFFIQCQKRFENTSNVFLFKGNSKYDLFDKIKDISNKMTFWLDSHWSGTPYVGCDEITICPVLEELEQIKQHSLKTHTIMIDDIRLMNNSNNKYNGFPINVEQIIKKIYEINPNYIIRYVNDHISSKDILVAFIEEKQCIHKYLTTCKTNIQPPGFADFLRGTIALYYFSKTYGYSLVIDREHPVFQYLNNSIHTNNDVETLELLPPKSYEYIYESLETKFKSGNSFKVLTNSFYMSDGKLDNWGKITPDCAEFMKTLLTPSIELVNKLNKVLPVQEYKVIHLRFGDRFIHDNGYDESLYHYYSNEIKKLPRDNYILLSDSSQIARKLKEAMPALFYWDNTKIHLGDLLNTESSLIDTLVDFFIMTKAKEIISNGSGFSRVNSVIYNIKYTLI